jgi:hypothetical protein
MPAPGMVAARRGHVFVLERHMRGNIWIVHDSNSGRHRTRVHPRSIVGFKTDGAAMIRRFFFSRSLSGERSDWCA